MLQELSEGLGLFAKKQLIVFCLEIVKALKKVLQCGSENDSPLSEELHD